MTGIGLGPFQLLGINPDRLLDLRISFSLESQCLFLELGLHSHVNFKSAQETCYKPVTA